MRTALRIFGKALSFIVFGPVWLCLKLMSMAFWIAEKVTAMGLVRWALRVIMGFAILGSLIMGSWSSVLIIGLPAGFLYIFPYISHGVRVGCWCMRNLIVHGVWGFASEEEPDIE